uniref:Aegyptin/gSG7 salivary protein-like four-helix bundle domain-containing protein n=1 Tax=Anopheles dirus TaxID=7168 RepID=A0A182NXG9_9DIPT
MTPKNLIILLGLCAICLILLEPCYGSFKHVFHLMHNLRKIYPQSITSDSYVADMSKLIRQHLHGTLVEKAYSIPETHKVFENCIADMVAQAQEHEKTFFGQYFCKTSSYKCRNQAKAIFSKNLKTVAQNVQKCWKVKVMQ